jgi:hypothetical protein
MEHTGGILSAIEHSWLGDVARTSVWLYPTANVGHILALTVFAASVAMMDARLLGAFRDIAPGPFLRTVRYVAMGAFTVMLSRPTRSFKLSWSLSASLSLMRWCSSSSPRDMSEACRSAWRFRPLRG